MIAATSASIAALNGTSSTALEAIGRMLDERQLVMRVDARVAVPGKMLAAGGNALGLQRPDDRAAEPRDVFGAFGQRTIADRPGSSGW